MDLDWSWVQGLPWNDIGELRISDVIAGNDNLRIIFHRGGDKLVDPLPAIWILRVFQKKAMHFIPLARGMRRFHESRIVLQLSGRKQAVILIVTSRKEEHHGLVSRAVDRGRATRRQRGTVLSSQPPYPRKDARALVVAHRAHASACGQGCRSQSGHRPAIRGRVSAGGLGRPAAVESQSPGERDGRLSRVDPRLLREATSHDHRRGVRTHLSTDRVAPRAQPGAQVPQGSGPEVLPGPCDPRAAKKN